MVNNTSNLGDLLNLIKAPVFSEKSINLYSDRQYTFLVARSLTKTQIKYIIEKIFDVTIIGINTAILPIKTRKVRKFIGKKTCYKKAYVKLKEGDTLPDLLNN